MAVFWARNEFTGAVDLTETVFTRAFTGRLTGCFVCGVYLAVPALGWNSARKANCGEGMKHQKESDRAGNVG